MAKRPNPNGRKKEPEPAQPSPPAPELNDEARRQLEVLHSQPEYRLLHALSHVKTAAHMHTDVGKLEERKWDARRRFGGRNPWSDDPEERRGMLEGKALSDPPFSVPEQYLNFLLERMRYGSTWCESALKAIRDGGAQVLDAAMNPGQQTKSVELLRRIEAAKHAFGHLAMLLPIAEGVFDKQVERLAAFDEWLEIASSEFSAAMNLRHLAPAERPPSSAENGELPGQSPLSGQPFVRMEGRGEAAPDGPDGAFHFDDKHLTVLVELAAETCLMHATELSKKKGMPKYYALLRLLNEMEEARPPLVYRPNGERSGYAVTAAGCEELRKRDLLDDS